jgi:hypothetical protein
MEEQDDLQFFETPAWLVDKAWALFQDHCFARVLDACAGNGAMADGLRRRLYESTALPTVDCVEIDVRHHPTLRAKGYNVVGLDFQAFDGCALYSHIVMNPPFSCGAKYVLRAWDGLWEGEISAILNAETLRNPYSVERRRLVRLVQQHGSAQYFEDAFRGKARVDVALIYLRKPAECNEDWIGPVIEGLRADAEQQPGIDLPRELALPASFVEQQVRAFRLAVKAMREAVRAQAVAEIMRARLGRTLAQMAGEDRDAMARETLQNIGGAELRARMSRLYDELKDRAWAGVLRSTDVLARLSRKVQRQAESRFDEISKLEFTASNVWGFLLGLAESQTEIQAEMICDVFDEISRYHSDNVVFYRGWKSNDRHREAGMRIRTTRFILPHHGTESWASSPNWDTTQLLADFDKVFALLDGRSAPEQPMADAFRTRFDELKRGTRISTSYFDLRYYRQAGTIHFFPTRPDLIDRLNRTVGAMRKWLPPENAEGAKMFWTAYEAAEKMDRAVRAAVRTTGMSDPFSDVASMHPERQARGRATVVGAIEGVLAQYGMLDALDAEEARLQVGSPTHSSSATGGPGIGMPCLPPLLAAAHDASTQAHALATAAAGEDETQTEPFLSLLP